MESPSRGLSQGAPERSAAASPLSRSRSGPKDTPGDLHWFLKPHEIIALGVTLTIVIYYVFTRKVESWADNLWAGLMAASGVFLVFCATEMRDTGFMKRPHPVFWRVAKGITILYLLGCVLLLFQSPQDARDAFKFVDPTLGQPLPEKSYATDCRIYTPEKDHPFSNIKDVLFDEDFWISMYLSVFFEFLEYTFQHILLNFAECWWDHWIVDVLICNTAGIFAGYYVLRWFEGKQYDWVKERDPNEGLIAQLRRSLLPESWTPFHWRILKSPRRWFGFWALVVMCAVGDLNAFFLKYVLWHPPRAPIVSLRLVFWFIWSMPAIRELYSFIDNPKEKRIGAFLWLSMAIAATEILIIVRFSDGQYPHFKGHPLWAEVVWPLGIIGLILFTIFYFYVFKIHLRITPSRPPSPIASPRNISPERADFADKIAAQLAAAAATAQQRPVEEHKVRRRRAVSIKRI